VSDTDEAQYEVTITDEDANPNDPPVAEYRIHEGEPGSDDPVAFANATARSIFHGAEFTDPEELSAEAGTVRLRATEAWATFTLRATVTNLRSWVEDPWTQPAPHAEGEEPPSPEMVRARAALRLLRAMNRSEHAAAAFATATATANSKTETGDEDREVRDTGWQAVTAKAAARGALQELCNLTNVDYRAAWIAFEADDLAAARQATAELRKVLDSPF
jgi:hypothetical protein